MIIGLVGYAQSGKDTVAETLVNKFGFERRAFADAIREMLYDINPMSGGEPIRMRVDSDGWDKAKQHPEVRRLLQTVGVAARKHINEKVWINAALSNMDINKSYVITDVRFLNEVQALKDINAHIWRVERPGVGPVNNHVSELELADYIADITLLNTGTLEELETIVKLRLDPYLANQTH